MRTSEQTNEIIAAMLLVSKELQNPMAIADNPFYKSKYTPLDYLINHIKKVINKHQLFISQSAEMFTDTIIVVTRLFHESGQFIETKTGVPRGTDVQKSGAAITYARRYALSAMFNIASDMDNDGNETVEPPKDKFSEMPQEVKQLFLDKGYRETSVVRKACEACNYDWNLIKKNLEV